MSSLIIEGTKEISDGLYVIKNNELFKYKPNGGSVRSYHIKPISQRSMYQEGYKQGYKQGYEQGEKDALKNL